MYGERPAIVVITIAVTVIASAMPASTTISDSRTASRPMSRCAAGVAPSESQASTSLARARAERRKLRPRKGGGAHRVADDDAARRNQIARVRVRELQREDRTEADQCARGDSNRRGLAAPPEFAGAPHGGDGGGGQHQQHEHGGGPGHGQHTAEQQGDDRELDGGPQDRPEGEQTHTRCRTRGRGPRSQQSAPASELRTTRRSTPPAHREPATRPRSGQVMVRFALVY
jgi:hypothetical protein